MSIRQELTITSKTGQTWENPQEALGFISANVTSTISTSVFERISRGDFTQSVALVEDGSGVVIIRQWDEDAWNDYVDSPDRPTFDSDLFNVSENIG